MPMTNMELPNNFNNFNINNMGAPGGYPGWFVSDLSNFILFISVPSSLKCTVEYEKIGKSFMISGRLDLRKTSSEKLSK